jgi:hypothetical protein
LFTETEFDNSLFLYEELLGSWSLDRDARQLSLLLGEQITKCRKEHGMKLIQLKSLDGIEGNGSFEWNFLTAEIIGNLMFLVLSNHRGLHGRPVFRDGVFGGTLPLSFSKKNGRTWRKNAFAHKTRFCYPENLGRIKRVFEALPSRSIERVSIDGFNTIDFIRFFLKAARSR